MDADSTIISLENVCKVFDKTFTAVDNFNLNIKKGEFVTLLGPSGCGKTTTLRMIAGFDIPTSGKILLNGADITNLPPYQRPVNTVFQHYALFPNLDVYDNVAFGLKLKKIPYQATDKKGNSVTKYRHLSAQEIDQKVAKALEEVGLEEMEDRDINNLSGGQQQRVAIARAIVNEPQVLLLDEPLSALDHKMRLDMQIELKQLHKKVGITFVYVTHDQEEALSMSDTIVVMKDGVIMQVGTPEDIYNEPNNAFVADFIGESNIYNATMLKDKKVRFLGGVWQGIDDFKENEKVDVVIRPEDIELGEKGKGIVDAVIASKIFKGEDYSYVLNSGRFEILARSRKSWEVGETVSVDVEPENIQVMAKSITQNEYPDAYINADGEVVIGEDAFPCDLTKLVKGNVDGCEVTDEKGKVYNFKDAKVTASVAFENIELSDNLEVGHSQGTVVSAVWVGDHYNIIIRTDDEEDFIVNTPDTYNEGDIVSVDILPASIELRLKKDLDEYVEE